MKKLNVLLFAVAMIALSGCSVITGIFKAGAFVGIFSVIIVVALILWLLSVIRGR